MHTSFRPRRRASYCHNPPGFTDDTRALPGSLPSMKPLLLVIGFLLAVNAAVLGGIVLAMGFPVTKPIDIHRPDGRKPSNEEIGLVALLETARLSRADRPQLIVLGASVPAGAFPPALVQEKLPRFAVSNLAMPAATMTEILQLLDEALWALPPEVVRDSVLVLGINWISFSPDALLYSSVASSHPAWWTAHRLVTYVRKAADRSPPILGIGHPLRALLPRWLVLAGKERLRVWGRLRVILPAHPGEWLSQRAPWRFQAPATRGERERHDAAFPRPQSIQDWFMGLPVAEQTRFYVAQRGKTGTLVDERHFDNVTRLIDRATSVGMTVVIVDLPLPTAHRLHFPALAEYQTRLREAVAVHSGQGRVHLLELAEALPDDVFLDFGHARADRVEAWVDLLVDRLSRLLPAPSPRGQD